MLRTDTGNFNRFISSVGLLLLIAALLVPYFYFHDTDVLRISQSELHGLTPAARDALETRQRRTADLEVPVLVLAGALAIGGLAALWFGGRRLRTAQDKEDEALERKAKRDEVEFQRLSDPEIAEKREAEAQESASEASEEEAPRPQQPTDRPAGPPPQQRREDLAQHRATISRVEEDMRKTFEAEKFEKYDFRYEVKVVGRSQLQLDGIFRSHTRDGTDVILELKVTRHSRNLAIMVRQFADRLIALVARYRDIASRDATGWLVVVVPGDVEDLELSERRRLEDRLTHSLARQGVASIISEREIKDLPWRFRELFEAGQ